MLGMWLQSYGKLFITFISIHEKTLAMLQKYWKGKLVAYLFVFVYQAINQFKWLN